MQNNGTMELWFFMEKQMYYGNNYGSMAKKTDDATLKIMELWFTKEKIMVDYKKTIKLWLIMERTMVVVYKNKWKFLNKYVSIELW